MAQSSYELIGFIQNEPTQIDLSFVELISLKKITNPPGGKLLNADDTKPGPVFLKDGNMSVRFKSIFLREVVR